MLRRRDFLKNNAILGLGAATLPSWAWTNDSFPLLETEPTPAQKAWMNLGFGMFIHFGINTYYDLEWSDGTLDPQKFNPTQLDTDQWCRTAKAAGMKYIVVITKHHDGFCLWPSEYTDYSVAATPFKGDILAEVVNSAHKHGLKVGFYYSLWDRNNQLHDTNEAAYNEWMWRQLEELLTNYGEIIELWFDGFWKRQQSGWQKKLKAAGIEGEAGFIEKNAERDNQFMSAWRNEGAYRWQMDYTYQLIKSLQPDCLVMNNSTTAYPGVPLFPVDIRSGEKYTKPNPNDKKVWTWLGKDVYLPLQIETTMSVKGDKKFPSGNWFWHAWDHSVLSKAQIQQYLKTAQAMEANLLLNCGPSDMGKLRPEDERALLSLRQ